MKKTKYILLKISDSILFIATIFQIIVFIIKGAFPLAGISLGLSLIHIIHILYQNNRKIKIITLSLMGVYLLENIVMSYVYMPDPQLPILLFIVEIILDIAIIQKIIFSSIIQEERTINQDN